MAMHHFGMGRQFPEPGGGGPAKGGPRGLIGQQVLQLPGQGRHVAGRKQQPAFAVDDLFGRAEGVGADDRQTLRQRLEDHARIAFVVRGKDEDVGGAVPQGGVGDHGQDMGAGRKPRHRRDCGAQVLQIPRGLGSHQRQPQTALQGGWQGCDRRHDVGLRLARVDRPHRQHQHPVFGQAKETARRRPAGPLLRIGPGEVDAVGDQRGPLQPMAVAPQRPRAVRHEHHPAGPAQSGPACLHHRRGPEAEPDMRLVAFADDRQTRHAGLFGQSGQPEAGGGVRHHQIDAAVPQRGHEARRLRRRRLGSGLRLRSGHRHARRRIVLFQRSRPDGEQHRVHRIQGLQTQDRLQQAGGGSFALLQIVRHEHHLQAARGGQAPPGQVADMVPDQRLITVAGRRIAKAALDQGLHRVQITQPFRRVRQPVQRAVKAGRVVHDRMIHTPRPQQRLGLGHRRHDGGHPAGDGGDQPVGAFQALLRAVGQHAETARAQVADKAVGTPFHGGGGIAGKGGVRPRDGGIAEIAPARDQAHSARRLAHHMVDHPARRVEIAPALVAEPDHRPRHRRGHGQPLAAIVDAVGQEHHGPVQPQRQDRPLQRHRRRDDDRGAAGQLEEPALRRHPGDDPVILEIAVADIIDHRHIGAVGQRLPCRLGGQLRHHHHIGPAKGAVGDPRLHPALACGRRVAGHQGGPHRVAVGQNGDRLQAAQPGRCEILRRGPERHEAQLRQTRGAGGAGRGQRPAEQQRGAADVVVLFGKPAARGAHRVAQAGRVAQPRDLAGNVVRVAGAVQQPLALGDAFGVKARIVGGDHRHPLRQRLHDHVGTAFLVRPDRMHQAVDPAVELCPHRIPRDLDAPPAELHQRHVQRRTGLFGKVETLDPAVQRRGDAAREARREQGPRPVRRRGPVGKVQRVGHQMHVGVQRRQQGAQPVVQHDHRIEHRDVRGEPGRVVAIAQLEGPHPADAQDVAAAQQAAHPEHHDVEVDGDVGPCGGVVQHMVEFGQQRRQRAGVVAIGPVQIVGVHHPVQHRLGSLAGRSRDPHRLHPPALEPPVAQVMQQRVGTGLGHIGIQRKIGVGIEPWRGVAPQPRPKPQIMQRRVHAHFRHIGILCQIPGRIEQIGLLQHVGVVCPLA